MQLEACVHEYGRFRTHTTFACWLYLKVFKGCELSSYCRRGWLTTVLRIYPIQEKRLHIEWNDTSELTIDEFLLLLNLIRIIWYYVDRTKECWRWTVSEHRQMPKIVSTCTTPYTLHIFNTFFEDHRWIIPAVLEVSLSSMNRLTLYCLIEAGIESILLGSFATSCRPFRNQLTLPTYSRSIPGKGEKVCYQSYLWEFIRLINEKLN